MKQFRKGDKGKWGSVVQVDLMKRVVELEQQIMNLEKKLEEKYRLFSC
ncbi:hypothetical protein [Bacillus sp. BP-3]|nr:hypothetical protein [Bacillus sp. BP-3]